MIQFPSKQDLRLLEQFDKPFCLSIYAPFTEAGQAGTVTDSVRIELKNLVTRAAAALTDTGVEPEDIRKTLAPLQKIITNFELMPPSAQESLVFFAHPELFRHYRMPAQDTPYLITIERGFNLEPLLQAIHDDQTYYVLALSHNSVKLFRGGHYKLQQIHLKNFPKGLMETLRIDEFPRSEESHQVAPAGRNASAKGFHGQYNRKETDKQMLVEFFRQVDKKLHEFLHASHIPLVLGGADYLLPLYREVNSYPHVLDEGITGNLEHANPNDIREQAWKIVRRASHEPAAL